MVVVVVVAAIVVVVVVVGAAVVVLVVELVVVVVRVFTVFVRQPSLLSNLAILCSVSICTNIRKLSVLTKFIL